MTQKKVLGRGLGALIPQKETAPPASVPTNTVPLSEITANPYQPRKHFGEEDLAELTRSVREHGIVQPLVVTRVGANRYQLIAGERRLRAAQRAGLRQVPVVVKEAVSSGAMLELAIIENVQRQDLNPIEEAIAYQQLHQEFNLNQEEIAGKVGKERSTVANALRLLKLPEKVKRLVAEGELSMGHARALLAAQSSSRIESLADKVVRQGLNVRQTEQLVSETPKAKKQRTEKAKDVFTRDAEEKLTRAMRTKVEIERKRRGGTIRIHFNNEDELIRIFEDVSGRKR